MTPVGTSASLTSRINGATIHTHIIINSKVKDVNTTAYCTTSLYTVFLKEKTERI